MCHSMALNRRPRHHAAAGQPAVRERLTRGFPPLPFPAPWEEGAPVMALPSQELAFDRKISYTNRTRVSAHFSSMVLGLGVD